MPAVGDPILAEDLLFARKTANQTLAGSSTALQDVTSLSVAVKASTVYVVECVFYHDLSSGTTEDVQYGWVFPSGSTLRMGAMGGTAAGVTGGTSTDINIQVKDITSGTTTQTFGASTTATGAVLRGVLVVGSTAGTFKVQAAQATSGVNTIRVLTNSHIVLTRVA